MTIRVNSVMQLTVVETLAGEFVGDDSTVTTDGLNTSTELSATTTPPVTKYSAGRATMTAGAATIDLTSLPNADGVAAAVTFLGLKVQAYKLHNPGANAITVTFGATNPYLLHGTGWKIILLPGEKIQWEGVDLAPDVASGAKSIDIAGTLTQYLEFEFVAG